MNNEFKFPQGVRGWLHEGEGRKLFDLARGLRVLELGTFCGLSTACMAQSASHVVTIDHQRGDHGTGGCHSSREELDRNLADFENVTVVESAIEDVDASILKDFDMAFIDSGHKMDDLIRDTILVRKALKPDGIVAYHDYGSGHAAVKEFVDKTYSRLIEVAGTVAVARVGDTIGG